MYLRPAAPSDAERIRAIYNAEVTGGTATFDMVPRGVADQAAWLKDHSGPYPAVVAVDDEGAVVGFGSLSAYKDRPGYATTVEDSVYVEADRRGSGIGRALLQELIARAELHGFHSMIARIGGNNQASIRLHLACGFAMVGVEREVGRKFNRWLDVSVLQLLL
jgi:phosphinothricin acetyltransferase